MSDFDVIRDMSRYTIELERKNAALEARCVAAEQALAAVEAVARAAIDLGTNRGFQATLERRLDEALAGSGVQPQPDWLPCADCGVKPDTLHIRAGVIRCESCETSHGGSVQPHE